MQRIVLAIIVVAASILYVEPALRNSAPSLRSSTTVAQRYPLRARSKNFYDRSKISNSRPQR